MVYQVQITDLEARYEGDLSTQDQTYLETQLADAQAYVASILPQAVVRQNNGRLSQQSYTRVICNMVLRVLRNPAGLSSEGDGSYSYSYWRNTASGELGLTPDEVTILTGQTGGGMRTIGIAIDPGWS